MQKIYSPSSQSSSPHRSRRVSLWSSPVFVFLLGFACASLLWGLWPEDDATGKQNEPAPEQPATVDSQPADIAKDFVDNTNAAAEPQAVKAEAPTNTEPAENTKEKPQANAESEQPMGMEIDPDELEPMKEAAAAPDTVLPNDTTQDATQPATDETEVVEETSLARTVKGTIEKNDTLSTSFMRAGLEYAAAMEVIAAFKDVFNFRSIHAGNTWEVKTDPTGQIESFNFHYRLLEDYYARRENDALVGYRMDGETEMYVVPLAGTIEQSLSTSVWKLGESDALTYLISSIFAWDIDFYSDIRKGDSWRVLVEKHYYKGKFVKYGQILAASFHGDLVGDLHAYYFETPDQSRAEYFDSEGNALQKSFLRAPLDTTRVTSRFGFRMHPTLGKRKQHNGVDYGAPVGTPIWAIASGRVKKAGWMGACGKGVVLKHANGYESIYCHLSSIAMNAGQKIRQKQLVGRVGTTGRSTGPHLHFGLKKYGKYINPLKVKYEPGKPLAKKYHDRWAEARALLQGKLEAIELPQFYGPALPPGYQDATQPERKVAKNKRKHRKTSKQSKRKGFLPRPEGIHEVPAPK